MKKHLNLQKCGKACKTSACDNCKSQQQKDKETHEQQAQKVESAIERINNSRQGRVGNIFMMKKEVQKKEVQDQRKRPKRLLPLKIQRQENY